MVFAIDLHGYSQRYMYIFLYRWPGWRVIWQKQAPEQIYTYYYYGTCKVMQYNSLCTDL